MRIDLAGREKGRSNRKRRKGRRSRTFESAVAVPQVPARRPAPARDHQERRHQPRRRERAARSTRPILTGTLLRRLPAILILAGLVSALIYTSLDSRFFVYEAEILGAQHLGPARIYEASGIHEQNIFWLHPAQVARRIAQLDGVKDVRVRCGLPARVTIEVEERQPRILWRVLAQQRDWWLDAEGLVLPYHGDVDSPDTVFVVDSSQRTLKVGQRVEPQTLAPSVLELAQGLPGARLFYYDADRGLSFTQHVDGGAWPVYVGSSDDLQLKIQVMQALNAYLVPNGINPRYVDVRWPDHPVYGRPAGDTGGGGD
ncbi:MAG: FtsQ-type POTRA domain-containing protein [Anaerolineae bacterium]